MPITITRDPQIKDDAIKPLAIANKTFPYADLPDHRRFEELLYSLFKQEILNGRYKDLFDGINLMQGVRERGRDCGLLLDRKNTGLIQCKHSISGTDRISAPECAREIIKFVLHYLTDNKLIDDIENFTYFFAVSHGFSENAVNLLDNFGTEIHKQDVEKITETVIKNNIALQSLNYSEIEAQLKTVLSVIKIKKIVPQDLDLLLLKPENQFLISGFFEVRTVVDNSVFVAWTQEIIKLIKTPQSYNDSSDIPANVLIKQMKHASFNLENYEAEFGGLAGTHINRLETKEILNWVFTPLTDKENPLALVIGNAGIGKTVILRDMLLEMKAAKVPVIGIKADRYYVNSIGELEKKLDLKDSLERICKSLQKSNDRIIILIDQIDALSLSLSSRRDYLDTFRLLIEKLSVIDNVRIIVSVRTFDLNYDSDLSSYKQGKKFVVKPLDQEQIKAVLDILGVIFTDLSPQLIELLKTPHHLNVFCKIYTRDIKHKTIRSLHDLYSHLWDQKIVNLHSKAAAKSTKCKMLLYAIADRMNASQNISISSSYFKDEYGKELRYLKSNQLLTEEGGQIQFFHQTFYDYCYARQFIESGNSVKGFIKDNNQSLFIRSSLKMIMTFLRESNHNQYIPEVNDILNSKKYLFHIKLLIINLIGFEQSPTEMEFELVSKSILYHKKFRYVFIESSTSEAWLRFLIDSGILTMTLSFAMEHGNDFSKTKDQAETRKSKSQKHIEFEFNIGYRFLIRSLTHNPEIVLSYLKTLQRTAGAKRLICKLLYFLKIWDSPTPFKLFEELIIEFKQDTFGFHHTLEHAAAYDLPWVLNIYKQYLAKRITINKKDRKESKFSHDELHLINFFIDTDSEKGFDFVFNLVKDIIFNSSFPETDSKFLNDLNFWMFDYENSLNSRNDNDIMEILLSEIRKLAVSAHPKFRQILADHADSKYKAILMILIMGILENPIAYSSEAFTIITHVFEKSKMDGGSTLVFWVKKLIGKTYVLFDSGQRLKINQLILKVSADWEKGIYEDDKQGKTKHRLNVYGQTLYAYLCAIPEKEVLSAPELKKPYLLLQRKFNSQRPVERQPNSFRVRGVPAPLTNNAYKKMKPADWISSFRKFNTDIPFSETGSMLEHSRAFQQEVKDRPAVLYPLIARLFTEDNIPDDYIIKGIEGLVDANFDPEKVKALYKLAMKINMDREQALYLIWKADYFNRNKNMDSEILSFLSDKAINHPDPEADKDDGTLQRGANTVRGAAVNRIVEAHEQKELKEEIFSTLERVLNDPAVCVRVCMMPRLAYLMNLDEEKTMTLFISLTNSGDQEIISNSFWSVQYLVNYDFKRLIPYFKLISKNQQDKKNTAILLSVEWLKGHTGVKPLLKKVWKNSPEAKGAMVDVALGNFFEKDKQNRQKCTILYKKFLQENDDVIVQEYSSGFLQIKPQQFLELYPLLKSYVKSRVAKKDPHYFFQYLIKCVKLYPIKCLKLLISLGQYEQPDITKSGHYEEEPVQLTIAAYNSLNGTDAKQKKYRKKALILLDTLLKDERFRTSATRIVEQVEF